MAKTSTSRPLRRKTSHSVIERRRREKINEGLISLQQIVPACRQELKELLVTKAQSSKSGSKYTQEQINDQAEELLEEKIGHQMVLEKLCIISHTVDYVRELEQKVDAYRRLCECSPQVDQDDVAKTHDSAHASEKALMNDEMAHSSSNEVGDHLKEPPCQECAVMRHGKRHWGSNNPIQLNRRSREKRKDSQIPPSDGADKKKYVSPACKDARDSDLDPEFLELDEWHGDQQVCSSSLYTDFAQQEPFFPSKDRRMSLDSSSRHESSFKIASVSTSIPSACLHAPLGLLADVSEDMRRRSS